MELSFASVAEICYIKKTIYNLTVSIDVANLLREYRNRKSLVDKLSAEICVPTEQTVELLCDILIAFEDYPFKMSKDMRYYYVVKDT